MNLVPEDYRDLISGDSKAIAYVTTILEGGAPITAPVWFGVQDNLICFVSSPDSVKVKNLLQNPQVAILIQDPDEVYRYMQIRGIYVRQTTAGSADYLHQLSNRYIGKDYPEALGGDDVIVYIEPQKVNVFTWDES